MDHKVRSEQFKFFAESLKSSRLRTYVSMMVEEAEVMECIKELGEGKGIDIWPSLSQMSWWGLLSVYR